jgi:hypothetical protein
MLNLSFPAHSWALAAIEFFGTKVGNHSIRVCVHLILSILCTTLHLHLQLHLHILRSNTLRLGLQLDLGHLASEVLELHDVCHLLHIEIHPRDSIFQILSLLNIILT